MIEYKQFERGYVLKVRYEDCTNFEGIKIMVYRGLYEDAKDNFLDPHFARSSDSPIARFRPDDWGMEQACKLAESL